MTRRQILTAVALSAALTAAADWPQWRGPTGDSVSVETDLPVKWSADQGVLWKCPLPGEGASTPAVWGDAIFVTAQRGDDLLLVRVNSKDGSLAWERKVGSAKTPRGGPRRSQQKFHNLHNLASPSPVTDGERVVVHFGSGDLAAYDFAGNQLWHHNLQADHGTYTIWWGHANSPVLFGDLVISVCMQDSLADLGRDRVSSYLVAHDKRTGARKWYKTRETAATSEECDAYTTPVFHHGKERVEMVVMGGNQLDAYDPATGEQLWKMPGVVGGRTVTGPTLAHGIVYCTQGKRGPLLAVKLGGSGQLGSDAVAWSATKSTPDSPCPVVVGELIFWVTDDGFAECRDARTGAAKWRERIKGDYKGSPLAADGKLYLTNLAGVCTVLAAKPSFEKLAENALGEEGTGASPAAAHGRLHLRGKGHLFCVGVK